MSYFISIFLTPAFSLAYFGGFRPGFSTEAGHPFRTIPAAVSDLNPATFEVSLGTGGRNRCNTRFYRGRENWPFLPENQIFFGTTVKYCKISATIFKILYS
jgi:hypothetical protein